MDTRMGDPSCGDGKQKILCQEQKICHPINSQSQSEYKTLAVVIYSLLFSIHSCYYIYLSSTGSTCVSTPGVYFCITWLCQTITVCGSFDMHTESGVGHTPILRYITQRLLYFVFYSCGNDHDSHHTRLMLTWS